ncbi:dNTP triphosphohydrolase [Candidatus Peregrinibacteria bacterium]|nr:dNTP triphosphohydrolase [Candidatus Peregrinibacteria bacterium]
MHFIFAAKKDFEKMEKKVLAPYAVKSERSRGREFPETEDLSRTVFQRDCDRIVHSKPFRRLSGKTQVFVATYGDHFRDRLTHTLEVAKVARDIARNLKLNEDLVEAIALAHDLGHTPFGHAGEAALDKIMRKFGLSFEHNKQSKRIVEKLEKQFPNFEGLNLSYELRQGLEKHQTVYDQNAEKISGKTLEAQVVDIADEIAYHNHDLDDGLRSKLFNFKDLQKLVLWREASKKVYKKYGKISDAVILRHRFVSQIFSLMAENVIKTAARNIARYKIKTPEDVLKNKQNIVCFSSNFSRKIKELRRFLWNKMYNSPRVKKYSRRGQKIIEKLFWKLYKNPKLMPKRFWGRIATGKGAPRLAGRINCLASLRLGLSEAILSPSSYRTALAIVVKDYVAGCTDEYAIKLTN